MRLPGKVAIVTGGGSGIGHATAQRFAQEGACVVVADINTLKADETAELICSHGGKAISVTTDMSKEHDVEHLTAMAIQQFGGIDILFNNAAIQVFGKAADASVADWDTIMGVNLRGYFLGCKFSIPSMISRGAGSIVNNASVLGLVGDPDMPAYCATKGGVLAMSRSIAQAYGRQGIRINSICPGDVDTPLVQEYFDQQPDPASAREKVASHYALGRIARPEEIAATALFLASDESSFVTGSTIVVDGGLTTRCY